MKRLVTALCAGAFVIATASPGFALMKGNTVNPDYRTKYSSGPATSTDMAKPPRTAKKPKRR